MFEECPRAYKFKYIDKIRVKKRQNVYGFLGSIVHETLEEFHKDLKKGKKYSLEGLIELYSKLWNEKWKESIKVSHPDHNPDHFKKVGGQCIKNYYEKLSPFNKDETVKTELRVHPTIKKDGKEYNFQGLIDRLAIDKKGQYIIHDYKTGKNLPSRTDLIKNRQLPLYQIGVQQKYTFSENIVLAWHYLRFGEIIKIEFDKENLDSIRRDIIDLIQIIEEAKEENNFPAMREKGANCGWCDYQKICQEWKPHSGNEGFKPNQSQQKLEYFL
ncbi:hypothetical protein AKJ56_00510 [candidate division MSBL1 archaeon SCGC-AAA382N08]|uniref:PD-(D/E)XK endonuclease-like domain-containing protein n=1 Tax=candidate division MSBL1 archaeon SCGC-AAA382N08 TaxID=1698285 RepID=A0A133VQJ8_9EURY|nr:hypothetical protein AKJ56_00510 [candidate division MSBL1 archaeon SCGC-AAA382N08]